MKIKVSIVEDDAGTRDNLLKVLQFAPQLTCLDAYPNAEEAVRGIPARVPNVVLMDIRLPGMSGIECVGKLKEVLPKLDILMLTTYEESDRLSNRSGLAPPAICSKTCRRLN